MIRQIRRLTPPVPALGNGALAVSESVPWAGLVSTRGRGGAHLEPEEIRKLIDQQIALLYFGVAVDPTPGAPLHSPVLTRADVAAMPPKAATGR